MNTEILGVVLQIFLLVVISYPLGKYIAKVYKGEKTWSDFMKPVERLIFKVAGINPNEEMNWKQFLKALLILNAFWFVWGMVLLVSQGWLPLNPDGNGPQTPDQAFNTCISFMVNCNLQHYSGESGLTYFTQLFVIMLFQFITAATGMAAMAGINLNAAAGADAISPDLYPDVVQSTPFLLELFPVEVTDKEKELSTTLYDYMSEHQRKAWWGYIVSAPFKALGAVMSLISGDEEESEGLNPYHLTKDQEEVVKALQERVSVSVDKKTLVITASVQMQDPVISAQMTKVVLENLQNYITNYRTQKVKQDLEFTQKVFGESRDAYYKAQRAYAAFEDANRNIISSSYRTEQERLKNEMTLTFNVYNTLAQKLEQDKLRVQEETPVYTVIEPATVPLKASSPKKALILVGFVFLALFGCIGYLFVKDMFVAAFKKEETEA